MLIHGAEYFARLYEVLCTLGRDDWVHLTDLEGDPDERLAGPDTAVGDVLADLARRGVHVRGLLWRSRPRQAHFSEQENIELVREVNNAGGEMLTRFAERGGRISANAENIGRHRILETLRNAGGDRVAFYDLENVHGTPIYIHAKVCVIDDVWMEIGSDNLNRRSWTHDSELSCAVLDTTYDEREPLDPAGLGDRARVLPRHTRLRLWREHLGRDNDDDLDLVDFNSGFDAWSAAAAELDGWHRNGRLGPRPPGHAQFHEPEHVPEKYRRWAHTFHELFVDPDGRPRHLRRADRI